jgi:hypothetical protein
VFKKRWPLRVSACGKRTKRSEREKSSTDPAEDKEGEEAEEAEGEARPDKKRRRDEEGDRKGKRPKGPTASDAALRRLKHKVRTRPECVLCCSAYRAGMVVAQLCASAHSVHNSCRRM